MLEQVGQCIENPMRACARRFLSAGTTYSVQIVGTRDVNGVPGAFYAEVNINGQGAVRLDFPTVMNNFVLATTPDGTEFTGEHMRD